MADQSLEPYNPSQESVLPETSKSSPIQRDFPSGFGLRRALGAFKVITTLAIASQALGPAAAEIPVAPIAIKQPESTVVTEGVNAVENFFQTDGVTVWTNEKGTPTRWQDIEGNHGDLNVAELERQSLAAKDLGYDGESNYIRVKTNKKNLSETKPLDEPPVSIPEKPIITELPKDVVSKEELAQRGIEIVGAGEIKLSFREGAFEEGGLLEDFRSNGDHKLVIITTDSPTLSPFAFDDPIYDKYRAIIEKNIAISNPVRTPNQVRASKQQYYKTLLNSLSKNDAKLADNYKRAIAIWQSLTDEEIKKYGIYDFTDGLHISSDHSTVPNTAFILLAFGERKMPPFDVMNIKAKSGGGFSVNISSVDPSDIGIDPKIGIEQNQSYPSTSEFPLNPNNSQHPKSLAYFTHRTPGAIVRHEFGHLKKLLHPTGNLQYDHSETETDKLALSTIDDAYTKMQEHHANTGYYIILSRREPELIVIN